MAEPPLLLQCEPLVATVVFNRPEARNALNEAMQRALPPLLEQLHADADVRVLILRGAGGKAFAAGDDITQFVNWGAKEALAHYHHLEAFIGSEGHLALIEPFGLTEADLPEKTTEELCRPVSRMAFIGHPSASGRTSSAIARVLIAGLDL